MSNRNTRHTQVYSTPKMASMLKVKTAGSWLKDAEAMPQTRRLFGPFWFERELSILFADTNMGKSILAVQIGDRITQGSTIGGFAMELPLHTKVLYIDFELSTRQFEMRYSAWQWGAYPFSDNFYRAEFDPTVIDISDENHQYSLRAAIEEAVTTTGASIVIIDNITWLGNGAEKAAEALTLMKHLKALKDQFNLSILVLAHTPKRNASKPITVNDLQGSKMLINFCDSAFAIGKSYKQAGLLYIKQIKQRATTEQHGESNVCLCRIITDLNNLVFEFDGFAHEDEHLYKRSTHEQEQFEKSVSLLKNEGLSERQIAKRLNVYHVKVHRALQRLGL